MNFDTIEMALESLKNGGLVIVSDNEDRENEGDLIGVAELVTPESINFMITHARGLVCMPMDKEIAENLGLQQMVKENTEKMKTAFTVSIDGAPKHGVTTGISTWDRAETIKLAVDDKANYKDVVTPGHIFPLVAKSGGVLERDGHTEAAVDLAKLAGYRPAGVICEVLNSDGKMALRDDLAEVSNKHNIPFITINQLQEYIEKKKSGTYV